MLYMDLDSDKFPSEPACITETERRTLSEKIFPAPLLYDEAFFKHNTKSAHTFTKYARIYFSKLNFDMSKRKNCPKYSDSFIW